jgi:FkbM family methyltransferase
MITSIHKAYIPSTANRQEQLEMKRFARALKGSTNPETVKSLLRGIAVYKRPIADLFFGYILQRRPDQDVVALKTPTGLVNIRVWCQEDRYTIHEIFAYEIYKPNIDSRTFLDIGANIGVSVAYFLSRNSLNKVVAMEAIEETVVKLSTNLAQFSANRSRVLTSAVVDGKPANFKVESTGRYSGLDAEGDLRVLDSISLSTALTSAHDFLGSVNVVKIDVEGSERYYPVAAFDVPALKLATVFCEGNLGGIEEIQDRGFKISHPYQSIKSWGEFVRIDSPSV